MLIQAWNPVRLKRTGFTLLELVAVVAIVLILITLLSAVISRLPGVGDRVRCTANLRGLAVAFNNYIEDNGYWPRQPNFSHTQQKEYEDWWLKEMKPYDVSEKTWQCPAIVRLGKIQANGTSPRVQYSPTMFDSKPGTARKWPNMPWLIEIANVHGHGPLMILPDGSVHDYDLYVAKYLK